MARLPVILFILYRVFDCIALPIETPPPNDDLLARVNHH